METIVAQEVLPEGRTGFARVHVVTVTHNSATTVLEFLEAIRAAGDSVAGVTVVDNASDDSTVRLLRSATDAAGFPLEVIENENSGFAGGYRAAAVSGVERGIPVLCLNPDVMLAPDAITALLDVMNSFPDAGVVTTPLVEVDGSPDSASRRKLPTLLGSVVYSVLGKLTPRGIRYNGLERAPEAMSTAEGRRVTHLEATTGALMLVHPAFRTLDEGIFDCDYWMYGEDLQLCADAASSGRRVLMAEVAPSVHIKGVSSGRPRSRRSNRAFHEAMLRYAKKNLVQGGLSLHLLRVGVGGHFVVTELRAVPARLRKRHTLLRSGS